MELSSAPPLYLMPSALCYSIETQNYMWPYVNYSKLCFIGQEVVVFYIRFHILF